MHQNWRWCMTKNPFVVEALWAVASRQDCREGETSSLQSRRHRRQRVARSAKPDLMLIKILCSCQPTRLQRGQNLISTESQAPQTEAILKFATAPPLQAVKMPRHWASIHVDAKSETLGLNSCRCQRKSRFGNSRALRPYGAKIHLRPQVVYLRKIPQRALARESAVLSRSRHTRANDAKPGLSGSGYGSLPSDPHAGRSPYTRALRGT